MTAAGHPSGPPASAGVLAKYVQVHAREVAVSEGRVRAWIATDPDPTTASELQALLDGGDTNSLVQRFAGRLEFGTAGLRGALGGGPNRMNLAVVRCATAGVAHWLHATAPDIATAGVVVGFDHRHGSRPFARETAGVLAAAGIPVQLADRAWPTPVTAYAVRYLGCAAGVMVTASHNPAPDNGYKVYDRTGSQIVGPSDAMISEGGVAAGRADAIPCDAERFTHSSSLRVRLKTRGSHGS